MDRTTHWIALRAEDLDFITAPALNVVAQEIKKPTPGIITVSPDPLGCTWIYFNVSKPPFDNKKLRQAVAHAIDKKQIVNAAYWGQARVSNNQRFLEGSQMYIPVEDRRIDLVKAKQLLSEAGYPDGLRQNFFNSITP